ncbi:hypothetical protein FA13DRAFT_1280179 [Coprinellus micaceus]|uniref:Uncharacterized protein n=1 Tax=Coprinellus micaceus TaxID=71717 RepID=A0A4Y7SSU7_COPMI|nr:hypothetical protein FA13DRAFT_1280179 [Coprinellus micaceus]
MWGRNERSTSKQYGRGESRCADQGMFCVRVKRPLGRGSGLPLERIWQESQAGKKSGRSLSHPLPVTIGTVGRLGFLRMGASKCKDDDETSRSFTPLSPPMADCAGSRSRLRCRSARVPPRPAASLLTRLPNGYGYVNTKFCGPGVGVGGSIV